MVLHFNINFLYFCKYLLPYSQKHSTSRSPSPRRSRGDDDIHESRSHSKSSKYREHKERSMKNYSRSRSHSLTRSRKSYRNSKYESRRGGSRSRSRSPYRTRMSRSRSRSCCRSRYSKDRGMFRSHSRSPMSSRRRHVGNRDNPIPGRCIGVFGLSICTTEQQLYHIFSKYGPVERVVVVIDAKVNILMIFIKTLNYKLFFTLINFSDTFETLRLFQFLECW